MSITAAAEFGVVLPTFLVAHSVADHWVQSDADAAAKGGHDRAARIACARHVATYTLTLAVALTTAAVVLGVAVSILGAVVGLALNAAAHYWADRRDPLRRLAEATGKGKFWQLGAGHLGSGAYALDQSWHVGCLWVAALLTVAL